MSGLAAGGPDRLHHTSRSASTALEPTIEVGWVLGRTRFLLAGGKELTMKAVLVSEFGGPEALRVEEIPVPAPGAGQIRVRVGAAGVNPMDGKIRAGAAFFPVSLPVVLGREFAGRVDAVAPDVDGVEVGDRVVGLAARGFGTYAEYTIAGVWVRLPDNVSFEEAVASPIAAGTASRVLDQLTIGADDVLLVNGASGAVGSMAVQLAVARGATVIGTAGPANQDAVRGLGATPVVYGEGLVERVRAVAPRVTAVFDVAGKGALPLLIEILGDTARIVTIADDDAERLGVTFSTGAGFEHDAADIAEAVRGLADGSIRVKIASVLPLEEAGEAHRISDGGHPGGKLILRP